MSYRHIYHAEHHANNIGITFLYHSLNIYIYKLENTEGAIKNGQSRETSNIWYTRRIKTNTANTNTPQYVLDTTMRKQTHITYIRHKPTGGKDHIMFVVCFF